MPDADTPAQHLLTLRDLMRYAVSQFGQAELSFGHGSDNAWDEAAFLLLHTLHLPLDTLEPFLDARLLSEERERCLAMIQRRTHERLPAAYLTGQAWLRGHRFIVDPRVIIPRSHIAELLDDQLTPWVDEPLAVENVLDLCTGSGCLAILAAYAFPNAQVDAVDISPDALEVAAQNVELHRMQGRVALHAGNLFDQLPRQPYDLILCNPPYVNAQSMRELPEEYRHEPELALAGGDDGMDIVRRLLAQAADFLSPHGMLVLEIGNEYDNFTAAFPELEPIWLDTEASHDQVLMLNRDQLLP